MGSEMCIRDSIRHCAAALAEAFRVVKHAAAWKWGISFWPQNRFHSPFMGDYRRAKAQIFLVLVSENMDAIKRAEETCIREWRANPRQRNRNPGGEGGDHGWSPHFLYLAVGRAHGWR